MRGFVRAWGVVTLRVAIVALVLLGLPFATAVAAVFDVTPADVTPGSFSVVWVSDQPVTSATVRVFADAGGTTELTGSLDVTLASLAAPPALARGVVKVDVVGVGADTCYYVQTSTTGTSTVLSPAAPPFTEVCTAVAARKANDLDEPIANDLITLDMSGGAGSLLVVSLPGVGAHPLAAFAGSGIEASQALVDLNNLFDPSTGTTLELATGELMEMTQVRGLLCPALASHRMLRYRRVPEHEETAVIGSPSTEVETGALCFFADTVCDDTIDILDAQRVLNAFGTGPAACAFNQDFDIIDNDAIDVLDLQSVLNRLGQSAPFE